MMKETSNLTKLKYREIRHVAETELQEQLSELDNENTIVADMQRLFLEFRNICVTLNEGKTA